MPIGSIFNSFGNALVNAGAAGADPAAYAQMKQNEGESQQIGMVLQTATTPGEAITALAKLGTPAAIQYAQQLAVKQAEANQAPASIKEFQAVQALPADQQQAYQQFKNPVAQITPYQQEQLGIDRQRLANDQAKAEREKAPNKEQSDAALYATRMQQAENTLQKVTDVGFSPSRGRDWVPNELKSEAGQLFDQAQRNFINANLRRESGAVISDDEFDNARKQYFPQPGDTAANLAEKAQNRQTAIKGISNAAGSAQKNIPAGLPKVGIVEDGYKFKGGNPADPKNWEQQ